MRLSRVPVTPAPPRRPLTTRSAALIERRAMIVRLSSSTEIALAKGGLNRPSVRYSHGAASGPDKGDKIEATPIRPQIRSGLAYPWLSQFEPQSQAITF